MLTENVLESNAAQALATAAPVVIPALQTWSAAAGTTHLGEGFVVEHCAELAQVASTFLDDVTELTGLTGLASSTGEACAIVLALDPELEFPTENATALTEGYRLEIGAQIRISARTATGVYWGSRSLLQMLGQSPILPSGVALDWPNYPVRGFMLDVGRRFSRPEVLRDYIRFMSWFKLNTFMVHLNDNEIAKDTKRSWSEAQQGFRLASEQPWLAGLAAEDGSYSKADWDSFEDVAALRHVQLVPEIDVPAHSRSFIRWRPELGLNDGDSDMLDLAKPESTELIKAVFDEFVPWFRGRAVHFGADEYARGHAQVYKKFFNDISGHLQSLGKGPVAWGSLSIMNDGAGAGAPGADGYNRDVTICAWNKDWYSGQAAVSDGYKVINTDDELLYIVPFADYYQGKSLDAAALYAGWEPHIFGTGLNLYPGHPQLLGAASAVWNDLVLLDYDEQTVHEMVKPAFAVLAHKMWRGAVDGLDFEEFAQHNASVARWPGKAFLD